MNNVILIGRLARDPELSYTPNTQTARAVFTLAVSRPRRNGEDQGADFIRITVWGKQAENCDRYISKGRQVAVHGRIQTGSYKKNGETVYTTDIVADHVEFLGNGNYATREEAEEVQRQAEELLMPKQEQNTQMQMSALANDDLPDSFQEAEDDIPF